MKDKLKRAKNFVLRHKTAILVGTTVTAVTVAVIQHDGIKSLNEFLAAKGLTDEYYRPELEV